MGKEVPGSAEQERWALQVKYTLQSFLNARSRIANES